VRDAKILIFEPFRVDVADERLWRGEDVVRLTNKAFCVLRHLAEHPAKLVTKDELLDAVWPDTNVSEAAMTVCIRELRQALEDDAQAPRFIETVRGRGYRFVAKVTIADRSSGQRQPGASADPAPGFVPRTAQSFVIRPASLVGREIELARLHQWFDTALEGVRRVGFIIGEAGIGKTTLVDAFMAQVESEEALWIGHGQCVDQYGAGEAYLPLLEALGRMCRGPQGGQLLALLRRQAPSWLVQMPALLSEAERVALQREESGTTQARMLRELAEAVEQITAERPLLLVLEDLHWSDASTLAWLSYVARRPEAARLLVLATYRPVEAIVAAHPLRALTHELRGRGQCEELLLDYLSEDAVAAYLAGRCPGREIPAGLAHMLHQRTDGNPLFLVTLVNTLVREGKLVEGTAGWELPEGLEAIAVDVPEGLRHLIELHLENVPPEDQTILEAGSVVGAEFSAAAVAAGVELEAESVEARCEAMTRRAQFVQAVGSEAWPDGTVAARYRFLHALHQEVLYNRIPPGQRNRWHRQIGKRLEAGHGGKASEIAAELAEHFVRGGDAPRAVQYLRHAGENARQRSAYQEAIAHLTRGIEVLGKLPDTVERARREVDLQTTLGLTYMAAKGYATPEVGTAYARALALCQQLDDAAQLGRVLGGSWIFHLARAEFHTAREMAEQMLELGETTNDPDILGPAHHGVGQVLFHTGEFAPAKENLEQAFALFTRQLLSSPDAIPSVQDGRVISLGFLAFSLWHLGYPDQAFQKAQEALTLARELSHPFTLAYALFFVAAVHGYRGEHARVHQPNEEMLALSLEHGFPVFVAAGTFIRSLMLIAQGKIEIAEGIAQISQTIDAYRETGAVSGFPMLLAVLAELQMAVGQVEGGLDSLSEAQATVDRTGERRYDMRLSLLKGKLLLGQASRQQEGGIHREKIAEAEACFTRAVDVARQQKAKSLELEAVLNLSRLWQQQGRRDEARELLADVYGWFTEGLDTADLKTAKALLEELIPRGRKSPPRRKR
jgi:DNA-binding winged helix-turn-helix (wHTH) protein/tetratricopeptide (TPR) repeat protein